MLWLKSKTLPEGAIAPNHYISGLNFEKRYKNMYTYFHNRFKKLIFVRSYSIVMSMSLQ